MINEIVIEHALHKNRKQVFLRFDYDREAIDIVKTLADTKWSHTHKAWHMSLYPEAITQIKNAFEPKGVMVKQLNEADEVKRPKPLNVKKPSDALPHLSDENNVKLKQFKQWMQSKRYAESSKTCSRDNTR